MILTKIIVRSLLYVFGCFLVWLGEMSQLVGISKSFASQKVCKLLTSMLVIRKALEGAKGKTIHRP